MIEKKIVEIEILVCPKCGHEWQPRNSDKMPISCPRCRYYLDKANKKKT